MDKLIITDAAKRQFKTLGVECINNAKGVVYLHGTMRNIAAAISKLIVLNPGVRVQCMNTVRAQSMDTERAETIEKSETNEKAVVLDACVIFEDINPDIEDINPEGEWYVHSLF